ncbi:MAG: hypothetical protein COS99_08200 [Candidatus Omnitrophica bacterium CG07_land_8_20_14_0_80_42_15]|uniref:histidine kinase n=1 Tax=Candidatus Aquitaenariimonas noxiae TaxID=1974741 RepID=A0A2J0L2Z3_9BACT|nr:MAG: hypothetical protein COS99_08200 [Candidatus Omnitrophica bacterium CG07_land_8_20_14_0_80_42_15]
MRQLAYFNNLRITAKFILWFLFIALVPLIIATYISYSTSKKVLEKEVANSLLAVADDKANRVESYLHEKEKNVTTLSYMSDIVIAIEKFDKAFYAGGMNSPEYTAVDQEFRPFLAYYQKAYGYEDLVLIRPNGEAIFSVKKKEEQKSLYEIVLFNKNSELAKVFMRAKESSKTEISDFEYNPQTQKASAFIAAPVFRGADLVGVVILQMNNDGICELVKDYAGLGKTGETIIASKIGNDAVFIAPTRFDPNAAFTRKITIGSKEGLGIQKAVQGEEGSGTTIDCMGKETLGVWRNIPSFRLGMVVKMDTEEVITSARELRNTLLKIGLALLALITLLAAIIANSVSRPIKDLTAVAGVISGGDFSARVKSNTKDEIGELANSFNKMTDALVQAKANVELEKEKVEEQKVLLEKVNKELDAFVYTASHDLRAPLRGISSFASFLEEDYKSKLDEQGKDYLNEIRKGADRMNRLIEDLLKLSRVSRIKNPYEDVDINELISSITERIKFDITHNKVDLKIHENIPIVHCDRIKLGEVFLNLINNAIKFSSKNNKENPKVEVGYLDGGEFHKFYVKDNGIGIDPKYHSQIFGLFKRLHSSDEYEGTGAGLSIVKKVIDDHGGNIWIDSEVGKGAAFYFTIPKDLVEKKKIGEILVEDGLITEAELEEKLKKQKAKETGTPPDKIEV